MPGYPSTVLIVGNGGRENALGNALLLSPRLERLLITPANYGLVDPQALHGGASRVALFDVTATDIPGVVALAREQRAELVVIGPEAPLVAGLADALRAAGIPCVGPGADSAQLEGSKRFAKQFMARHGVPTAGYREFDSADALLAHVETCGLPVVLKADGLAAGKGVLVCLTREEAIAAARALMVERVHGDAAGLVIAEEFMTGPEISFICLVAGGRAEVLPPGSDYKRLRDGDAGPNTGGMGNICPTPHCDDDTLVEFVRDILAPTVRGLKADGLDYRGFLFVGTMLTPQGLKVVEYNVRFGDPEAEVMLPLCDADWPAVLGGMAAGELPDSSATTSSATVPGRAPAQVDEVTRSRHWLPHFKQQGAMYFVTWRIGAGQPDFAEPERDLILSTLLHFDADRYYLYAAVVMNDHVHVLVQPAAGHDLGAIMHSWNSFTANRMQRDHGRQGSLWQNEHHDRIVRDEEELYQKANYILTNPQRRWPDNTDYRWVHLNQTGWESIELRKKSATRDGRATGIPPIRLRDGACVAVMLASAGYPDTKAAPAAIEGLDRVFAQGLLTPQPRADGAPGWDPPPVQLCFAGVSRGGAVTRPAGSQTQPYTDSPLPWDLPLLATGGRVLCISARAADLSLARRLAYEVAGNLHFDGMQLRTDIGRLR